MAASITEITSTDIPSESAEYLPTGTSIPLQASLVAHSSDHQIRARMALLQSALRFQSGHHRAHPLSPLRRTARCISPSRTRIGYGRSGPTECFVRPRAMAMPALQVTTDQPSPPSSVFPPALRWGPTDRFSL